MDKIVTIATYYDVMQARLARSLLEGTGILCYLSNENLRSIHPLYRHAGGMELQVLEQDAQTALALLRGEGLPDSIRTADTAEQCPGCGSTDIRRRSNAVFLNLLTILLGSAVSSAPAGLRCKQCGHRWK